MTGENCARSNLDSLTLHTDDSVIVDSNWFPMVESDLGCESSNKRVSDDDQEPHTIGLNEIAIRVDLTRRPQRSADELRVDRRTRPLHPAWGRRS